MRTFTIVPHVGVGPVRLGEPRTSVQVAIGHSVRTFNRGSGATVDAYFDSAFQVSYAADAGVIEFIELAKSQHFRALFDGVDVFSTPALELIGLVERHAAWDSNNPESGYSYIFPDLDLSLWRASLPDTPTHEEGRFFEAIGIGVRGYFRKSAA